MVEKKCLIFDELEVGEDESGFRHNMSCADQFCVVSHLCKMTENKKWRTKRRLTDEDQL